MPSCKGAVKRTDRKRPHLRTHGCPRGEEVLHTVRSVFNVFNIVSFAFEDAYKGAVKRTDRKRPLIEGRMGAPDGSCSTTAIRTSQDHIMAKSGRVRKQI